MEEENVYQGKKKIIGSTSPNKMSPAVTTKFIGSILALAICSLVCALDKVT